MNPQEEIIWKNIQRKDEQVFEDYYKKNYKAFFLLACKYVKIPAQAQEIVNDVFVKLWQDGHKMNIESSLKSYIYKAVINRCINALNKSKKDRQSQTELSHVSEGTYELRRMEENDLKIRLYTAIDQLPEQCKKVFLMSRFEGLKQQEIADRLGISIKTVKNHITHALKQLGKSVGLFFIPMIIIKELCFGWV